MLEEIIKAIILGIVQGATEFFPISSSAHLIVIRWFFGWSDPALASLSFDVALHLGTFLGVMVFFANDWIWLRLIRAFFQSISEHHIGTDPDRRLVWLVLIGTIPGGIAGLLWENKVDALFHRPSVPISPTAMIVLAGILAGFGVLLLLTDRFATHVRSMRDLTPKDTLLIGLSQALAIFPGVSRSGSTITTGLALGFKRETAVRFSFLLSAPIMAGAGLKSLWEICSGLEIGAFTHTDLILFLIGFIMAAFSGFLCIRILLNYLQKHNVNVFVYYRWALALLIVTVTLIRG